MVRETLLPIAARSADAIGPAIDISSYTGAVAVTLNSTAATAGTLDVTIQTSPAPVPGELNKTDYADGKSLRDSGTENVKLSASWTQAVKAEIAKARIPLRRVGTIADGKTVTLGVHADDSGDPASTALSTASVSATSLSTNFEMVEFDFSASAPTCTATNYHFVLSGDYTASTVNFAEWGFDAVTSGGNGGMYGTSWEDDATVDFAIQTEQYAFTNYDAFDQVDTSAASSETINLLSDDLDQYLRVIADVDTGPVTSIVTLEGNKDS